MLVRELRPRPDSWAAYKTNRAPAALPFHIFEWTLEWSAYYLSRWALLEVLEYLSVLSVLVAVVFYFTESGDRQKQKHYQAWQVINTAQGKGGSGGRIEALQELNRDHVPLVGLNAAGAFLQGLQLPGASMVRADFEASDLRDCDLHGANLEFANLRSANFRQANLTGVRFRSADLFDADLVNANLAGADLHAANLENADLRNANLAGVQWKGIGAIAKANIFGVRNAPDGFAAWAIAQHAVSIAGEE